MSIKKVAMSIKKVAMSIKKECPVDFLNGFTCTLVPESEYDRDRLSVLRRGFERGHQYSVDDVSLLRFAVDH